MFEASGELSSTVNESTSFVSRYGGEEFTVLLPDTEYQEAFTLTEKLRCQIEATQIPHEGSPVHQYVTISAGVASVVPEEGSVTDQSGGSGSATSQPSLS